MCMVLLLYRDRSYKMCLLLLMYRSRRYKMCMGLLWYRDISYKMCLLLLLYRDRRNKMLYNAFIVSYKICIYSYCIDKLQNLYVAVIVNRAFCYINSS